MIKFFVLNILLLLSLNIRASVNTIIKVCDDIDEWPPYSYYQRIDGKSTEKVTGFSIEFLDEILNKNKLNATYTLIPWPRCLEGVKNGEYDIALNASLNPLREKEFLISKSYYTLTEAYLYKKELTQNKLISLEDLKQKVVCGQIGFNYVYLGLADSKISSFAQTFEAAVKMIKAQRCDLIPVNYEVLLGYKVIGVGDYLKDPELKVELIPGISGTKYYMFFNKGSKHNKDLKKIIDQGIMKLQNSLFLKKLTAKYLQNEF